MGEHSTIRHLLSTPLGESLAGAAAGAVLARLGTGAAIRWRGDRDLVHHPAYLKNVKRASWLIGAALGGINPLFRDDPRTWAEWTASKLPQGVRHEAFSQQASSPFAGTVDLGMAADVVGSDLFLNPAERRGILGVMGRAPENRRGETSQFGLTQAALRAGISFVPAYAFGELATKALGLPKPMAKAVSRTGALAFALRSSGIMEYL